MHTQLRKAKDSNNGFQLKKLRQRNTSAIIKMFRESDELTARDISEKISLSRTSINKILGSLQKKNIILDSGKGASTESGGKKPDLFILNASRAYCISLNFSAHFLSGALIDLKLNVRHTTVYTSADPMNREQLIDKLVIIVHELIDNSKIDTADIYAIILQCAGIVDKTHDSLALPINDSNWGIDFPIKKILSEAIDFQPYIFFDNMCRFYGYYELLNDVSRTYKSLIILSTFENNVGGSVLINGSFNRGSHGLVGEFGHFIVERDSEKQCICGNFGCFEKMVSQKTVLENAQKLLSCYPNSTLTQLISANTLCLKDVFFAADRNDPLARVILDEISHYFYLFLYNALFFSDPDEIIIQNLYAHPCNYFQSTLYKKLSQQLLFSNIKVTFSVAEPYRSAHVGAALYAADHYFADESIYQ